MDRAALRRAMTVTCAAAIALAACSGTAGPSAAGPTALVSVEPSTSPARPSASAAPTGPPTVSLEEIDALQLSLEGAPDWPTGLDGSVWIQAPDGALTATGTAFVYRLDAGSGEEQARIEAGGGRCQGIGAGFGSLWVCTDTGLARVDPATNRVVAEVPFPAAAVFVRPVAAADRVWMLSGDGVADAVVEIDPRRNEVVATHRLGHPLAGLAFGAGAVWATSPQDGLLLRLDPRSGDVTVHASDLPAPVAVSFAAGELWLGLRGMHGGDPAPAGEAVLVRISAADGSDRLAVDVGLTSTDETDIVATSEAVWVRSAGDPFLLRLDPGTGAIVWAVAGSQAGGSLAIIDGALWTTSIGFHRAWRIDIAP